MNIYVHFPFCRSKCAYCALHSRANRSERTRREYVARVARELGDLLDAVPDRPLRTLYFGGGTPSLCDLRPLFARLAPHLACMAREPVEFTVELNPCDVTPTLLECLKAGGVNRLSMGVQSFDDPTLREMGRPHTADQALHAWRMIREAGFDNAGIDLICGWPGARRNRVSETWRTTLETAVRLSPDHCSVYTLILEEGTRLAQAVRAGLVEIPSDDIALEELSLAERLLAEAGLERYEISSFAKPGKACRHNLAVWRGEDYTGIGEGACSREGGAVSRTIFRLRLLKEGFSPVAAARDFPELLPRVAEWHATLDRFASEGLLTVSKDPAPTYRLTSRGTEVCDTILAELV